MGDEDEFVCTLCFDEEETELYMLITAPDESGIRCSHSYCMPCIKKWMKKAKDGHPAECPACKRIIQGYTKNMLASELMAKRKEEHDLHRFELEELKRTQAEFHRAEIEEIRARESELLKQLEVFAQKEAETQRIQQEKEKLEADLDEQSAKIREMKKKLETAQKDSEAAKELLKAKALAEERQDQLEKQLKLNSVSLEDERKRAEDMEGRLRSTKTQLRSAESKLLQEKEKRIDGSKTGQQTQNTPSTTAALASTVKSYFSNSWISSTIQSVASSPITKTITSYIAPGFSGPFLVKDTFSVQERRGSRRQTPVFKAFDNSRPTDKAGPQAAPVTSHVALKDLPVPAYVKAEPAPSGAANQPNAAAIAKSVDMTASFRLDNPIHLEELFRNKDFYNTFREAMILSELSKGAHAHVLKPLGLVRDTYQIRIVYPFIEDDLGYLIETQAFTFKQIRTFMAQLLSALAFLHRMRISHRDISPTSILVTRERTEKRESFSAILAGFSQVRSLLPPFLENTEVQQNWTLQQLPLKPACVRSRAYWAPEVLGRDLLEQKAATFDWQKADVWSLVVVFFELLTQGRKLVKQTECAVVLSEISRIKDNNGPDDHGVTKSLDELIGKVAPSAKCEKKRTEAGYFSPYLYKLLKASAKSLLTSMLQYDPTKRCSAEEALKLPFFKDFPILDLKQDIDVSKLCTDANLFHFVTSKCGGV